MSHAGARFWILCGMVLLALGSTTLYADEATGDGGHAPGTDLTLRGAPLAIEQSEFRETLDLLENAFNVPRAFLLKQYGKRIDEALIALKAGNRKPFATLLGEFFTTLHEPGLRHLISISDKLLSNKLIKDFRMQYPVTAQVVDLLLMGAKVARPTWPSLASVKVAEGFEAPFVDQFLAVQKRNQAQFHDMLARYKADPEKIRKDVLNPTKYDRAVLFNFLLHLTEKDASNATVGEVALQNQLATALAFKDPQGKYALHLKNASGKPVRFELECEKKDGSAECDFSKSFDRLRQIVAQERTAAIQKLRAAREKDPKAKEEPVGYELVDAPHEKADELKISIQLNAAPLQGGDAPPAQPPAADNTGPKAMPKPPAIPPVDFRAMADKAKSSLMGLIPSKDVLPLDAFHGLIKGVAKMVPAVPPVVPPAGPPVAPPPQPVKRDPAAPPAVVPPAVPPVAVPPAVVPPATLPKAAPVVLDEATKALVKQAVTGRCQRCHDDKKDPSENSNVGDILSGEKLRAFKDKPDDSPVMKAIMSAAGAEKAMPPGTSPRLTKEQIDAIRKWISAGAPSLKEDAKTEPVPPRLPPVGPPVAPPKIEVDSKAPPAAPPKIVVERQDPPAAPPKIVVERQAPPAIPPIPPADHRNPAAPPVAPPPQPVKRDPAAPPAVVPPAVPPAAVPPAADPNKGVPPAKPPVLQPAPLPPAKPPVLRPAPLPPPALPPVEKLSDDELTKATQDVFKRYGLTDRNHILSQPGYLVPGDLENSGLYQALASGKSKRIAEAVSKLRGEKVGKLPPPPSKRELDIIAAWIKKGAKPWDKTQGPATGALATMNGIVKQVSDDIVAMEKAHPSDAPFLRYFSLKHLRNDLESGKYPATERDALVRMINQLSTGPKALGLKRSCGENFKNWICVIDGADDMLFRVDMRALGWTADMWKAMKEKDPFFKDKQPDAALTKAQNWLTRGDWFVKAMAGGEGPAKDLYAKFLGIPDNAADIEKKLQVGRGDGSPSGIRAALQSAPPDGHQVLIERLTQNQNNLMPFYRSYNGPGGPGEKNLPARLLEGTKGQPAFTYETSDIVYRLPNGLHAFVTVDKSGKVIRTGIAPEAWFKDGQLAVKGDLRPKDESPLYPSETDLAKQVADDNVKTKAAIAAMTDAKDAPKVAADPLVKEKGSSVGASQARFRQPMTIHDVAIELGKSPEDIRKMLRDPKNAALAKELKPLMEGGTVRREVFNASALHLSSPENAGAWPPVPPAPPQPPKPVVTPKPTPPPERQYTHIGGSQWQPSPFGPLQPIVHLKRGDGVFIGADWTGSGWRIYTMERDPRVTWVNEFGQQVGMPIKYGAASPELTKFLNENFPNGRAK